MAGRRYTFKEIPEALSVPVSFRIPESVAILLTDRIAKLPDIETRSEALQDALVKWLMIEEFAERKAAEAPESSGSSTTLEEIVESDRTGP